MLAEADSKHGAGRRHPDAPSAVVSSVLSIGVGPRLAVVAGLIALLWLAVWWALTP